ncbi:MAG TPA: SPW repeat protein [Bacteroidia bacterium]|nr:SPW repeat protein [Bacteroidia bacterium]
MPFLTLKISGADTRGKKVIETIKIFNYMKVISTKVHGVLDYAVSLLLIASPWLVGYYRGGTETWVAIIIGLASIAYSLITDYELGATKALSMSLHLSLDFFGGLFLMLSPWLLGFYNHIFEPHLLLGLFMLTVVAFSKSKVKRQVKVQRTGAIRHAHS